MKYWVFSVARSGADETLRPVDVYRTRMDDRAWGFHTGASGGDPACMQHLRDRDKVVFYIAGQDAGLAGIAELDSEATPWAQLKEYEKGWLSHPGRLGFQPDYVVKLCHVERWEPLRPRELLPWTQMPQGSIHEVMEEVYQRICNWSPQG